MSRAERILLKSDGFSPNSQPHDLPALHWRHLFKSSLEQKGPDRVEEQLRSGGWDPQWRFGMYQQAHYHSTTHELLVVICSSATILLGGTDDRAKPKNKNTTSDTSTTLEVQAGDTLLLPAGYAHRVIEAETGFTMIGSYPKGSDYWDSEYMKRINDGVSNEADPSAASEVRFPNINGCPHDSQKIKALVVESGRKGLFSAQSPELLLSSSPPPGGQLDEEWSLL